MKRGQVQNWRTFHRPGSTVASRDVLKKMRAVMRGERVPPKKYVDLTVGPYEQT